MITATINFRAPIRVDGLVNRGDWFGRTWLVGIGCGFDTLMLVVEGDCEQDCIDVITDHHKWSAWLKTDDMCQACEDGDIDNCSCQWAGNYCERVNLNDIRILEQCKVNYFASNPDNL